MRLRPILILWMAAALLAQDLPDSALRSTIHLVQLNVIVRDSNGPVLGLSADDFAVFDNGKRQRIAVFQANTSAGAPAPADMADSTGLFHNRAGSAAGNVTLVLLDGLNTDVKDQQYARQQFLSYLREIRPDDRVAVYTLGTTLHVLTDFTADPKRLAAAVRQFQGDSAGALADASGPSDAPDGLAGDKVVVDTLRNQMNDLVSDHAIQMRAETTAAALEAIAHHVGYISGRKNLIWISAGFPFVIGHIGDGQFNSDDATFDDDLAGVRAQKGTGGQATVLNRANDRDGNPARSQMSFSEAALRATRALNDADIAVYPVDARGLTVMPKQMTTEQNYGVSRTAATAPPRNMSTISTGTTAMRVMADSTGGLVFQNTNGLRQAIQAATHDSEATYTLGFYPDSATLDSKTLDSKFHALKVQVHRKHVDVRYRRSYEAVPDSKSSGGLEEMRNILRSPLEATAVSLTAGIERTGDGAIRLQVAINPGGVVWTTNGAKWVASLEILIVQHSKEGAEFGLVTTQLPLSLDQAQYDQALHQGLSITRNIVLGARTAELRVLVADRTSGKTGSLILPVDPAK